MMRLRQVRRLWSNWQRNKEWYSSEVVNNFRGNYVRDGALLEGHLTQPVNPELPYPNKNVVAYDPVLVIIIVI